MSTIKSPLWQKVTSNALLATLLTQLSFPVYASIKTSVALEDIQSAITYSARYELMESVDEYLYRGALEKNELGVFDGFGHFFTLLRADRPELIPGYQPESEQDIELTSLPPRFGSPYVERGVIRQQMQQILNKSWLSKPGYSSYNEQTKKLYENAVDIAKQNNYQLGQRLTQAQINALTKDVVWPEIRDINGQNYLVPFLYLTSATIEEQQLLESTFVAESAEINTQTFVIDGSRVEFKHKALIDVEQDFINTRGHISGQEFTIRTGRELQNLSGTITGDDVTLIANKLTNNTLVTRLDYGHGFSETFNQIGSISALGSLNISSATDVVTHGGEFSSQGEMKIRANGNIILVPQARKDQRAESGQRWSDSESSLVNLQTSLSAVDTLSLIAGGQVFIQGAEIQSQGLLQILAGHGITLKSAADLKSFDRKFEAESGGVFGTKESEAESGTEAKIVRTLLKAGQSMLLSTVHGNVLLEAVTVDNKGMSKIIAENGAIDFELAKLLESYSYSSSSEGSLAYRHKGHGYQREVAYYSEFVNSGGLFLDASTGVRIQVASGSKDLDQTLAELAQSSDLAWMQEIRNNPEYSDIDWESVELVMKEWDYDQSGLSPAAMAILAIAMAVAMGPGGLAIAGPGAGATITISNVALAAAVNAGFGALVVQTSSSLLANGFDVNQTMKHLASKQTLTNLATSMVTAGVLSGLDIPMFGGENGAQLSLSDVVDAAVGAGNELAAQAIMQVINSTVTTGISALANGHSLDEFGDAFVQSLAMSAVMRIGKELANDIGEAASTADGKAPDIDTATQYIVHAALGCGLGTAISGINGGNSDANRTGCASGAAGGVIGEYVAKTYLEDITELETDTKAVAGELIDHIQSQGATDLSPEALKAELLSLRARGADISRLMAGVTVFAFGGNVDIAISTAGNAAENNALQLLLVLLASEESMALLSSMMLAYTAKEFVMSVPETFEKGSKLYHMYTSGNAAEKEAAKQEMINLALQFGFETAVSITIGGAVTAVSKEVLKQASVDEIAGYLAHRFSMQGDQVASDVFRQISNNIKFKQNQYEFYREQGGNENYDTWSTKFDNETYQALKTGKVSFDDISSDGLPDMGDYFRYVQKNPKTSISPERYAQQRENGYTIVGQGYWQRIEKRQANIPDDPKYHINKRDIDLGIDAQKDMADFMQREVKLPPDGQMFSVERAIDLRKEKYALAQKLRRENFAQNRDQVLALDAEVRNLGNALGVARFEHNIRSEFVSVRPLAFEVPGRGEQGQLDGLYEVVDKFGVKKLISGESKASIGKPHYGTRQVGTNEQGNIIDARQGSDEYHKAIWANMQTRYDRAMESNKYDLDSSYRNQTEQLGETLDLLKEYQRSGRSDYIEYRGAELIFNKDGSIKRTNNVKFEVTASL
ncbi:hypothetical protein GCM10007938_32040 [Vibrio zhanjiangensis]|uniref:DUF637 domain-containing protein n=1 Tax=Vibrio zhanjiangensis TaxID=1046128 RepID=A0ABQ6F404_9VIBR|nr:DUF637 domain-containing protein [Vibrio zhanjiangensis]GLT19422.1 hypothetical protein GCM10007938_32040 [Vibrio zhanjiangensis]